MALNTGGPIELFKFHDDEIACIRGQDGWKDGLRRRHPGLFYRTFPFAN